MAVLTTAQLRALSHTLEEIARKRVVHTLHNEQRAAPRLPFRQVMRVCGFQQEEMTVKWQPMLSLDVSRLGLGLISASYRLAVGTDVIVDCVPGSQKQICIPGRVVRVDSPIDNVWSAGIQFEFRSDLLEKIENMQA